MSTLAVNPWQEIDAESVLFIIDAGHEVEERLLLDWLEATKQASDYTGQVSQLVLSIAHDPDNISSESLRSALEVTPDTLLVPIRVAWQTTFDKTDDKPRVSDLLAGNARRPNARKAKKILAKDATRAVCIAGTAATLEDLQQRYLERQKYAEIDEDLAAYVADQANLALEVAERRLRGSRYKVPIQVTKTIRASDRYKRGLEEISRQTGSSEAELRQQATPLFKELISTPHNFWQDVMASFNRKITSLGYEDKLVYDRDRILGFRQIVRENPSALLWTHKTHMDGLTIQSILFENDFPTPHTMGGINMAFAGLGYMARRSGAIFIRRSFQDNLLYKLILNNYLVHLLEKRFPLTWSFEGTRSRVGKLMPPRYGMLKYVMEAAAASTADNLHIIPVAINYDMINDVKDYAAEQGGAIKKPESLAWFISYIRRMRHPLGRIYVDLGEPVVIQKRDITDDNLALQKTAFKVGVEANRVTPITLTSLMCMSLLGAAPRAQTIQELRSHMLALRNWAAHRDIKFTSDFDGDNVKHMLKLIKAMVASGLINHYDEGPDVVYAVAEDQHAAASYYRNTIAHHFVSKAIAELSLLHAANYPENSLVEFWAEANRLRDMFKFEFFYAPTEEFINDIRDELRYFDADWEQKLQSDAANVRTILEAMQPLVAHGILLPYIEAYRIVLDVFAGLDEGKTLDQKETVAAGLKYGRQAYLQRRVSSQASIGKIFFENGYKLLDSYDLVSADAKDVIERRKVSGKKLRVLAHRLERLRALSIPNEFD